MRIYTSSDEEKIRTSGLVREWARSGLIEPAQLSAIDAELGTDLRRTNTVLRIVLFVFAVIVLQAALGLVLLLLDLDRPWFVGMAAVVAGAGAVLLGEGLIARFQFYRFGVEEACAVCAVALVAGGVAVLYAAESLQFPAKLTLAVASAAALGVYARYGYCYAALGAIAGAAAIPFLFEASITAVRVGSALTLLAAFVAARSLRTVTDDEHLHDEFNLLEAAAWLGMYLVLNLQLSPDIFWRARDYPRAFVLATHAAIWVLPITGLVLGIRGRQRWMIWANLVMALATLATNKMYLGWPRYSWDPILLGLLLIGVAIGGRRWLSAGPGGERSGFTPRRILSSEKQSLSMVSTVAGAAQPVHASTAAPDKFEPGGGSSGGGGATGRF
ncbi:MAG: hypothetical protein ABI665_20800 [Vicinamibacterales bacterium]